MKRFMNDIPKVLGVELPEDYRRFMEQYESRLVEDPVSRESWIKGVGNSDFVVGTTLAFRTSLPKFPMQCIAIAYGGLKTIIINRSYEEIDEYLVLHTTEGKVLSVDARGVMGEVAASFEDWIGPELLGAKLREQYTGNLTVVLFDDELKAEEARLKLLKLQRQGFIDLEDVVVVVKEAGGATRTRQMHKLTRKGGITGSITGLIVGSLLGTPLLGVVLGAASMAASSALSDVGIEDRFIEQLAANFSPGTSAVFSLIRKSNPEKVREEFRAFGGKILVSSVSPERAAVLQALLDGSTEGDAG
jgi:uncharacterized membrane protein